MLSLVLPRLVVFDLDNTLWTPELYELRKRPRAGRDIRLCSGAEDALYDLATNDAWRDSTAAVASRTHRADWAEAILPDFKVAPGISALDVLPLREIFPGSKRKHFQNLRKRSGVPYSDMIFFDDWTVNLGEVAHMGVLGIHCPRGLTTEIWTGGLQAYARLKTHDTKFMGRMFTPADLRQFSS